MMPIYTLLLIVALAVALAFLNNHYWEEIDTWWHVIQWLCVATFAVGYVAFTKEYFSALLVWSAVHWIVGKSVLTDEAFLAIRSQLEALEEIDFNPKQEEIV